MNLKFSHICKSLMQSIWMLKAPWLTISRARIPLPRGACSQSSCGSPTSSSVRQLNPPRLYGLMDFTVCSPSGSSHSTRLM